MAARDLPLLTGARANVVAGTYLAEQRSKESYDLLAAVSPRKPLGSATSVKGTPRRRVAGQRFEQTKCTELPALKTIDPLLNPSAAVVTHAEVDGEEQEEEDEALEEAKWPGALRPRRVMSRLYPGRSSSERLGEAETPVPTDAEFKEWLTIPPKGSLLPELPEDDGCGSHRNRRQHLGKVSPGVDSALLGTGSRGPNSGATSSMTVESPSASSGTASWNLLLLRSTFDERANTPGHVARCVSEVLGLEHDVVRRKVKLAQRRMMAVLATCEDRAEAFKKVQALRSEGLVIQVASEAGLYSAGTGERSIDSGLGGRGGAVGVGPNPALGDIASNYGELFKKSFKGTDLHSRGRSQVPLVLPPVGGQPQSRRWRGEGNAVPIEVLPKDPVEALFDAEQQGLNGEDISWKKAQQHRSEKSKKKNKLKGIITKNSEEIRRRSRQKEPTAVVPSAPSGGDLGGGEGQDGGNGIAGGISMWGAVLDAVLPKQKISKDRREACQMLRFFVYGSIGNEGAKTAREQDKVFYETMGTKEKVRVLYNLWGHLDEDGSGRVDIVEFRDFASKHMKEKLEGGMGSDGFDGTTLGLPSWANLRSAEDLPKFIAKLCDKLVQLLLGKKSSFVIEDMMRLIWPCATPADVKEMRKWFREFAKSADRKRVKSPPVLPESDFEGLCSVFRYFDDDNSGEVMIEELVTKGLIYEDQAPAYFRDWDRNGDGSLDLLEFCEMMCPSGYRAYPKATIGSRPDGTRIIFDEKLDCWRVVEEVPLEGAIEAQGD
mmetsp:Transcript_3726/g.7625  ORF Transcript_3726/g.7625 Transcript_3726/m.7625 type:complete len:772 (+) Transcript_3726:195-2510(+)